ncbi:MAG: Gfo/Idh/MocA family oxidoreductase [Oscillospiraceae bacterium]|nr:Gfo/Idh/MocA family oxidoreductase [Oscillospiraceae bacterium]MBR2889682.1 Gfo/Idh/MocA family oxidoreductase [Oscillospiraceae bacterium]
MKIGILGPGRMAGTFAKTLVAMEDVARWAVASRELARAEEFAREYGFEKAYGSYEAMLADPDVELVYIATPHSHHFEQMMACIRAGKNVLCEKAFTVNAFQARQIRQAAREAGVFVTEAIWTRYMPSRRIINEVLASGIIGNVTGMTANLCYPVTYKPRILDPSLCGGALLDVGIYGLNFALMHFGTDIVKVDSSVRMASTGVDAMESVILHFADGKMAVITAAIDCRSDRKGIIYGDEGFIIVENINNPQMIRVFDTDENLLKEIPVPEQISGYEYQIRECAKCLAQGRTESLSMPLEDTVFVMELMDSIRSQWGLVYPMEK